MDMHKNARLTYARRLEMVRDITHDWLVRYNEIRPHSALSDTSPALFAKQFEVPQDSWIF